MNMKLKDYIKPEASIVNIDMTHALLFGSDTSGGDSGSDGDGGGGSSSGSTFSIDFDFDSGSIVEGNASDEAC